MQPLTNEATNIYLNSAVLSPGASVQLLLLAGVIFVVGIVLVEGSLLAGAYAWLARVIGVKEVWSHA